MALHTKLRVTIAKSTTMICQVFWASLAKIARSEQRNVFPVVVSIIEVLHRRVPTNMLDRHISAGSPALPYISSRLVIDRRFEPGLFHILRI